MKDVSQIKWYKFAKPRDELVGGAVCLVCFVFYPKATVLVFLVALFFWTGVCKGRREDAAKQQLAKDRLDAFDGRQDAAFAAFIDSLGPHGLDPDEVKLIYDSVQEIVSPIDGPLMPLFADDKLLEIAYDEDDIDLDLIPDLLKTLPRNFDAWDQIVEVSKTETVGQLVYLFGLFPKS